MIKFYSLLFLLFSIDGFSQSTRLLFDYDLSGNQILRELITVQERNASLSTEGFALSFPEQELHIYPNPVVSQVYFRFDVEAFQKLKRIELVSYNGSVIQDIGFSSKDNQVFFDMSSFAPGIYYIKAYLSEGKILHRSLIKN